MINKQNRNLHNIKKIVPQYLVFILLIAILSACSQQNTSAPTNVDVSLQVDGKQTLFQIPVGSTVQDVLSIAEIQLSNLDKVTPPSYTIITEELSINVTRVKEEFEISETIVPFERQTVRNESLPEGENLLVQPGVNGIQQITIRKILEDGKETSRNVFKVANLVESRPEIVMVGVQSPFTPIPINGRIAFLTAGNAWIMENTTGNRRPVVTTGDLDGRIFSLSPDGNWLLFTRASKEENQINELWTINISVEGTVPIDLKGRNVIHYAEWAPSQNISVDYSTVEPRSTAPGWQANNDLRRVYFSPSGAILKESVLVETNAGGIYGWWGTEFSWSPDGETLAYARPDSIGTVDIENNAFVPLVEILPFQTRGDWAWVPGISWSADSTILYFVNHMPLSGNSTDETSPLFDLSAVSVSSTIEIPLVNQSGMFAYPAFSKQNGTKFAYLQALFPDQSETSRYRLMIIDQDGSNRKEIFPVEGSTGLDPQKLVWAPAQEQNDSQISLVYQGNIWIININTGQAQQITGDGLVNRIDWQ